MTQRNLRYAKFLMAVTMILVVPFVYAQHKKPNIILILTDDLATAILVVMAAQIFQLLFWTRSLVKGSEQQTLWFQRHLVRLREHRH